MMAHIGPLIEGSWFVPPSLVLQMQQEGKIPPPPVSGFLLIDTGADCTCISEKASRQLGLVMDDVVQSRGVGGLHNSALYTALLRISIDHEGVAVPFDLLRQVIAIPDLDAQVQGILINQRPVELIGLLGRDFLSIVDFNYKGSTGEFHFSIDMKKVPSRT